VTERSSVPATLKRSSRDRFGHAVSNADQVVSVRADQIRVSIDEVVTPDEPVEEEDASLAHVLDDVEGFMRRFLAALSDAHFTVLALFTAHTYAIGAADTTVYIHTTSAEVECGKTRLLEVLELLTHRPAMLLDPSAAALYRGIDSGEMVTLLIDEVDTYLPGGKADSDAKKTIVGLRTEGADGASTTAHDTREPLTPVCDASPTRRRND